MGRLIGVVAVILAVAAGTAWHYRATIKAYFDPPASADNPAEAPDVLYSWVDENGVTHFSAKPGKPKATRVEYDGSRITPVGVVEAPVLPSAPEEGEAGASSGNVLLDVRAEMERNAKAMNEAKAEQHDF